MSKVSIKVRLPRIDFNATKAEIHKVMTDFTFETLREWVLRTVDPIPVWSGAARASFLLLAAKAQTAIQIEPIAPTRILLGVTEATSVVFVIPIKRYGWEWESNLAHIGIVQDRVKFIEAGLRSIKNFKPVLPQPVIKK